jgi:hypothetical protein
MLDPTAPVQPLRWPPNMATLRAAICPGRLAFQADDRTMRPTPAERGRAPAASSASDIDAFLAQVKRLAPTTAAASAALIALDATMSRVPPGYRLPAASRQREAGDRRARRSLVHYRGLSECRAALGVTSRAASADERTTPRRPHPDRQGHRARQARDETTKVQALVFVGEDGGEAGQSRHAAGELGRSVPAFMFQEGDDPIAERRFARSYGWRARLLSLRSGAAQPPSCWRAAAYVAAAGALADRRGASAATADRADETILMATLIFGLVCWRWCSTRSTPSARVNSRTAPSENRRRHWRPRHCRRLARAAGSMAIAWSSPPRPIDGRLEEPGWGAYAEECWPGPRAGFLERVDREWAMRGLICWTAGGNRWTRSTSQR